MSERSRIVCFGEVLLRLAAPRGELLRETRELRVYVGGAEANVAIALAHLGHASALITVLPEDALGALCASELRRHGVDSSGVCTVPGRMGLYFLERGAGHRPGRVLYDREHSAFSQAMPDGVAWAAALQGAAWLHVSGITAALGVEAARALIAGVEAARERGIRVSFDCNYRPSLWKARAGEAGAVLRQIAEQADTLFANAHDLALMLERATPPFGAAGAEAFDGLARAALARFTTLNRIATTVRIERTADEQALYAVQVLREGVFRSRTYALRDIVERIGSGDAFAAGTLHGALSGFDPQRAVEFAAAAACLKHSLAGDFSVASAAEIEALLRGEMALTR